MIIDHRTYTVQHGMNKQYLDLFEAEGLPVQLRHLNLIGYFTTSIGPQNEFVHLTDMERRRAARDADPDWAVYKKKSAGMLVKQENKLITPVSFSPLK